jgi:hypothetical protein
MAESPHLHVLLARALRNDALGRLCRGESRDFTDFSSRISQMIMSGLILGIVFTISDWMNASTQGICGIGLAVLTVIAVVGLGLTIGSAVFLVVATWAGCLITQFWISDHDVWETIGVAFAVSIGAVLLLRVRRLTRLLASAPLVLPVTLSALLIPLFTADLWLAAIDLGPLHLFAFAVLTVVPLLLVVLTRMRSRLRRLVSQAVDSRLSSQGDWDKTGDRVVDLLEDEQKPEEPRLRQELHSLDLSQAPSDAAAQVEHAMRRQTVVSLTLTLVSVAGLASLYFWLLEWTLVPTSAASSWIGEPASTRDFEFLGFAATVPVGVYLTVASLLGIAATGVLLASAAVDDGYADRMSDAVLRRPATEAAELSLAYMLSRPPPSE